MKYDFPHSTVPCFSTSRVLFWENASFQLFLGEKGCQLFFFCFFLRVWIMSFAFFVHCLWQKSHHVCWRAEMLVGDFCRKSFLLGRSFGMANILCERFRSSAERDNSWRNAQLSFKFVFCCVCERMSHEVQQMIIAWHSASSWQFMQLFGCLSWNTDGCFCGMFCKEKYLYRVYDLQVSTNRLNVFPQNKVVLSFAVGKLAPTDGDRGLPTALGATWFWKCLLNCSPDVTAVIFLFGTGFQGRAVPTAFFVLTEIFANGTGHLTSWHNTHSDHLCLKARNFLICTELCLLLEFLLKNLSRLGLGFPTGKDTKTRKFWFARILFAQVWKVSSADFQKQRSVKRGGDVNYEK